MAEPRKRLLQQEPRVVERYVRLRMYQSAIRFSRFVMRHRLPRLERESEAALISALAETVKQTAKIRRYDMQASATLLNIALYFLIANRDIQAVKIDALTHPDAWKRSLCARVILLTIHELDMDKVAGIRLREALNDAGLSEEGKRTATQALRAVRTAQQKAQKQFAFHRNATIAHRDPDALLQYRAITELDVMATLQIAGEFFEGAQLFITSLPELMLSVGSMPGILKQLSAQSARRNASP